MSTEEFRKHVEEVFEPHHFSEDNFLFSAGSLTHGLEYIMSSAVEVEIIIEDMPYFTGKFNLLEVMRKMYCAAFVLTMGVKEV